MQQYTIVNYNVLMKRPFFLGLVTAFAMITHGECILTALSLIVTAVTVLTLVVMVAVAVVTLAVVTLVVVTLAVVKVVNLTGQLMVVQTAILRGMSMEFHVVS
jgi:hypothetical protein